MILPPTRAHHKSSSGDYFRYQPTLIHTVRQSSRSSRVTNASSRQIVPTDQPLLCSVHPVSHGGSVPVRRRNRYFPSIIIITEVLGVPTKQASKALSLRQWEYHTMSDKCMHPAGNSGSVLLSFLALGQSVMLLLVSSSSKRTTTSTTRFNCLS